MSQEEKLKIARDIYSKLHLTSCELEIHRDEELHADIVWVKYANGPVGLIIDDNGEYLACPSYANPNEYKEKFKQGLRNNKTIE